MRRDHTAIAKEESQEKRVYGGPYPQISLRHADTWGYGHYTRYVANKYSIPYLEFLHSASKATPQGLGEPWTSEGLL